MMARFCRYVEKVFDWSAQLESLRDPRPKPQIPTASVFLSALMMFAVRLGSVNALEAELRVPKRWDAVVGRRKPSADAVGRIAGKWVEKEQTSSWFWGTTIPQAVIPSRQLRHVGHDRWKIENRIFNALGEHWGLDHCFRHDPVAILNFILILFIAHTLVQCFYRLNMKQPLRGRFTLIAVATQILLGIAAWGTHPAAWPHPLLPPQVPRCGTAVRVSSALTNPVRTGNLPVQLWQEPE